MALVKCKECGNQISTDADKCPHCGKKREKMGCFTTLVMIFVAVMVFGSITKCVSQSKDEKAKKADITYLESLTPEQREAELKKRAEKEALELKKKQASENRSGYAYLAYKSVQKAVHDRDSLQIEWIGVNEAGTIACVDYHAKNGFGGYVRGTATFINGKPNQSAGSWNANCAGKSMYDLTYVKRM